jgi:tRNA pseudouridine55 synthase
VAPGSARKPQRAADNLTSVLSGIVVVDKPRGPSSHTVVAMARRALGTKKVGHAGTLDPLATGVLVLGINSATRLLTFLVGDDKTYEATIRLGSSTVTDDIEGDETHRAQPEELAALVDDDIHTAIAGLTGEILQRPSAVSAIKVDGQRAYDRVRSGEDVELAERAVTVSRFDVREIRRTLDAIDLDVVVDCSSGTYIRALARDLGSTLGVGGHVTELRRTRSGIFSIDSAVTPDDIADDAIVSSASVASQIFPVWTLTESEERDIRHGKHIPTTTPDSRRIAAVRNDELVAVVAVRDGVTRIECGFPRD